MADRRASASIVHTISMLVVLDCQMRAIEPDGKSLADLDRVARGLTPADLSELTDCLSKAVALVARALQTAS
jgi:hypothetical protein